MSIPKFLQTERPAFASIDVVPAPATHWCEFDRLVGSGRVIAVCGAWAERDELSTTPTCPDCLRISTMTGEEMFGEATPGATVVKSPHTWDLADEVFDYAVRITRFAEKEAQRTARLTAAFAERDDAPDGDDDEPEPNPREKGDDDGVEYADPRDHRDGRE